MKSSHLEKKKKKQKQKQKKKHTHTGRLNSNVKHFFFFFGRKNNGTNADLHQEIMCPYFSGLQKLGKQKYTLESECQVE